MATRSPTSQLLGPSELASWRGFLQTHARLARVLSAELEESHDLSLSAYEVLLFLADAPAGRLRMSELAASVLLTPSGITRLVDRLVADGLVEKVRCAADRRGAHAVITDAGRSRFRAARSTHLAGVRSRFVDRLDGADLTALERIWAKLGADPASRACP